MVFAQIFVSNESVPYKWNTFVLCSMEGYMEKVKMASLDRAHRKLSSEVQKFLFCFDMQRLQLVLHQQLVNVPSITDM